MINIAVMGYGTVGSGVVEVINTNHRFTDEEKGDDVHYTLQIKDRPRV